MICPPGMFCFNKNILVILCLFLGYFFYTNTQQRNNFYADFYTLAKRRIVDPLVPPEQSYIPSKAPASAEKPNSINTPTRGETPGFQQVGVLIQKDSPDKDKKILPLYGEPTYRGSTKWRYYTGTDGFQSVKLPVINKNRNCLEEYGCDEIYDGDPLNILAYENSYVASLYKLDAPRYLPTV
jgi:hypothetical protein